jgi:hypothetical protein
MADMADMPAIVRRPWRPDLGSFLVGLAFTALILWLTSNLRGLA